MLVQFICWPRPPRRCRSLRIVRNGHRTTVLRTFFIRHRRRITAVTVLARTEISFVARKIENVRKPDVTRLRERRTSSPPGEISPSLQANRQEFLIKLIAAYLSSFFIRVVEKKKILFLSFSLALVPAALWSGGERGRRFSGRPQSAKLVGFPRGVAWVSYALGVGWVGETICLCVLLAARHANDTLRRRHDREGQSTKRRVIRVAPRGPFPATRINCVDLTFYERPATYHRRLRISHISYTYAELVYSRIYTREKKHAA